MVVDDFDNGYSKDPFFLVIMILQATEGFQAQARGQVPVLESKINGDEDGHADKNNWFYIIRINKAFINKKKYKDIKTYFEIN